MLEWLGSCVKTVYDVLFGFSIYKWDDGQGICALSLGEVVEFKGRPGKWKLYKIVNNKRYGSKDKTFFFKRVVF